MLIHAAKFFDLTHILPFVNLKDPHSSPPADIDISVPKGAPGEAINESNGGKSALLKPAIDELKDVKKLDDESKKSKSVAAEGEARGDAMQKLKSDRKIETSGERNRDRDRERDRDRDRERAKIRDRDRGRDSDRERDREESERDKVKDRIHRSRDRTKDSGM